ncbi:MBL fold metallo-hydrolase [Deinococcus saxicola]|uniref:MBL fold metallo-hydrolase n=1 Tax=Deinococcus saxicola TaxID=249406 RepID=UPI0039EE4414
MFRHTSTAHSYVWRSGHQAVLINVGDGSLLSELPELGVSEVLAAVLTHAAWDVSGGVGVLAHAGIPVYAPEADAPFLADPQVYLNAWAGDNNYDGRPLNLIPHEGVQPRPLRDYQALVLGPFTLVARPAPGPTLGHTVLLAEANGERLGFTGALLCAPGQVPRLSATMWKYNGGEGLAGSILSLLDLYDQQPTRLLGAFGEVLAPDALKQTAAALGELLKLRGHNLRLLELRERPYGELRPWLLHNRTSEANSYVLLSAQGTALMIDFGYDFAFGMPPGTARDTRRPWLYNLPALQAQFGVSKIDAVIPTHAHDDHVAGIPLLREQLGTQLWVAEPLADLLAHPHRHRFPCRWFESILPDRVLALKTPVVWEEFQITPYALPGHARHAVALLVEGYGERLLFIGDQYAGGDGLGLNYTYQNDFLEGDYVDSAALISRLRPDVLLSGHWEPVVLDAHWLKAATARGEALRRTHAQLQPVASRLLLTVTPAQTVARQFVDLILTNPTDQTITGYLQAENWRHTLSVPACGEQSVQFIPEGMARRIQIVFTTQPGEPPLIAFLTLTDGQT